MIRVVSTSTLTALHTARAEAEQQQHQAAESAHRAEAALAELRCEAARLKGELSALRAQSLLDTEDRQALRTLLRVTRKQTAALSERVFVLFHRGAVHSVHPSQESAEVAAEAEGAPRSGWTAHTPGAALPPASEVAWRVQALPLGGIARRMPETAAP